MTHIATVVDRSSSIRNYGLVGKMIDFVNSVHEGHKVSAAHYKTVNSMTLITFADVPNIVFENITLDDVGKFEDYNPMGSTAIFDALDLAMDRLELFGKLTKGAAYSINVITDGENNRSTRPIGAVVQRMKALIVTGKWTITFQVPVGYRSRFCSAYNIPEANVVVWEQTAEGADAAKVELTKGVDNYHQLRSTGVTQTSNFFGTNLKASDTKINKVCDDVTLQFRFMQVNKEEPIKEFVEGRNRGKPYVIGSCYYQLTKPELVQASKVLLLVKKGTVTVLGGPNVRSLLGLPTGTNVKVDPGDHGDYNVFVLSTSVNRKLVRGTVVLQDKTKTTNSKSTWDHNAAKAVADKKAGALK